MSKELKPVNCGCGGEAYHASESCWNSEQEEWMPNFWHRVICKNCGTQTKAFYTKAEAIQAWNTAMGKQIAIVKDFGHPCGTYGYCSNCGGYCVNEEPYCPHCGAKVEWQ